MVFLAAPWGAKKCGQRPIEDGQLVAPAGEVDVHGRPKIVGTAQVDHGQGGEKRQHPRGTRVETQAAEDPTEMQPVAG